jgi:hypothetical protein
MYRDVWSDLLPSIESWRLWDLVLITEYRQMREGLTGQTTLHKRACKLIITGKLFDKSQDFLPQEGMIMDIRYTKKSFQVCQTNVGLCQARRTLTTAISKPTDARVLQCSMLRYPMCLFPVL